MSKCTNKKLGKLLYPYELNLLTESEREAFEIHIIECTHCYKKAITFKDTIELINHNKLVRNSIEEMSETSQNEELESPKVVKEKQHLTKNLYFRSFIIAASIILVLVLKPWHIEIHPNHDIIASENRLTIMYFENTSNKEEYNWYREGITNLLITDLAESNQLQVVSTQRLNDIIRNLGVEDPYNIDFDLSSQVALKSSSQWFLTGKILLDKKEIRLSTQLVNVKNGIVKSSQFVTGSTEETIFSLVDKLSMEIKKDLDLPENVLVETDPLISDLTTHSEMAYKLYLSGIDNYSRFYNLSAFEDFNKVIKIDSNFAMAYYYLSKTSQGDDVLFYAQEALKRSNNASQKDKLYIQSRLAILLGKREEAIKALNTIIEKYPEEKDAYYNLALIHSSNQNYKVAISLLKKAIEIDPLFKTALNNLAYIYNTIGDFDKSIETIDKYITIAPDEPNPYDSKGEILSQNGKIELAIIEFENALEKEPRFSYSLLSLIRLNLYLGNYEQVQKHIDHLKKENIYLLSPDKRFFDALLLSYQGSFDSALIILDEINIEKDSISQNLRSEYSKQILKAQLYREKKEYIDAIKEFEEYFTSSDSKQSLFKYCYIAEYLMTLCDVGMTDKANQIADSILSICNPKDSIFMHNIFYGSINYKNANYNKAVLLLQKGLDKSDSPLIKIMLGKIYLELKQYNKAIVIFSKFHQYYEFSRSLWGIQDVKSHYYLGIAYQNLKDYSNAKVQFEIFLEKWKHTDSNIVEIKDAKERLIQLSEKL